MHAHPMKTFRYLATALCIIAVAIAGCQSDRLQRDDNGSEHSAAMADDDSQAAPGHAIVLDDNNGNDYAPVINPANFVSAIDNPYFALIPGRAWIYESPDEDEGYERVKIEVTHEAKIVQGVTTTVVRAREWQDGDLVEDTFDWYAQDNEGNVWYFGEDSKEIEDGEVISTAGSWEAGVNGAKAGIIMKANPQVGAAYRQEYLEGEAEDMGQVIGVGEAISIRLGSYEDCVLIKDWTPLEPNVVEHKFYCRAVGNAVLEKKVVGDSGQIELVEFTAE